MGDSPRLVLGALSIGVSAEIWKEATQRDPEPSPLQGLDTEVTAEQGEWIYCQTASHKGALRTHWILYPWH